MIIKIGQVWSYRSRENEGNSRLRVMKIDKNSAQKEIAHVRIDG